MELIVIGPTICWVLSQFVPLLLEGSTQTLKSADLCLEQGSFFLMENFLNYKCQVGDVSW